VQVLWVGLWKASSWLRSGHAFLPSRTQATYSCNAMVPAALKSVYGPSLRVGFATLTLNALTHSRTRSFFLLRFTRCSGGDRRWVARLRTHCRGRHHNGTREESPIRAGVLNKSISISLSLCLLLTQPVFALHCDVSVVVVRVSHLSMLNLCAHTCLFLLPPFCCARGDSGHSAAAPHVRHRPCQPHSDTCCGWCKAPSARALPVR
jgi:hypothetical protein